VHLHSVDVQSISSISESGSAAVPSQRLLIELTVAALALR
jgi:hypothetical protein